jgi:hypothetical protein
MEVEGLTVTTLVVMTSFAVLAGISYPSSIFDLFNLALATAN